MSMRFCKECNNMLYAQENKDTKTLKLECKSCRYFEGVDENTQENNLVYRNEVKLGQSAIKIDPGIINDPTYARTKKVICSKCGHSEAIYFQNPNINAPGNSGMKLVFVCCYKKDNNEYCGNWWFNK